MEFQCFEVKPEDDSKEITECSYDDNPSTGIFSVFWWGNFLHWCSLCTTLMLWCFYCLSTRVNVNDTRLTCDKSVHLSVHSSVDKYVKVKCVQAYRPKAHQSALISSSLTFSQSKLQDYKHWTSALCVVSVYLSAFVQCQIILHETVECKNLPNVNASPTHTHYITSHHPSMTIIKLSSKYGHRHLYQ